MGNKYVIKSAKFYDKVLKITMIKQRRKYKLPGKLGSFTQEVAAELNSE